METNMLAVQGKGNLDLYLIITLIIPNVYNNN